jgi:hypothetical protein
MKQIKNQPPKYIGVSTSSENQELKDVIKELQSKYQSQFDLNVKDDEVTQVIDL